MKPRIVSHHHRIKEKKPRAIGGIKKGFIYEFKYKNPESKTYDKKPMVFVLSKKGSLVNGINLNYLMEYKIELLLDDFQRMRGERMGVTPELKRWPLFEKACRTYNTKHMTMVQEIKYETDLEREERLEKERTERLRKDIDNRSGREDEA